MDLLHGPVYLDRSDVTNTLLRRTIDTIEIMESGNVKA